VPAPGREDDDQARSHGRRAIGTRPRARPRIALAAQVTAQSVYERAGYEPYGEAFLDAGIEHVMMAKDLR
jgi:predicted GNAT family N-acyltransferase